MTEPRERSALRVAIACLLVGAPAIARAEPSSFTPLYDGGIHLAISADGRVVTGTTSLLSGYLEGFRWTAETGQVGLGALSNSLGPNSNARGVSGDGSVVVGRTRDPSISLGQQACIWKASTGFALEELVPPPRPADGSALAVSDDGLVVVGSNEDGAFRQSGGSGMVHLGDLPGGNTNGSALGVSADGAVVVGVSTSASGPEAFRWTEATGMVGLGDLPDGAFISQATDVTPDGTVVVGTGWSASGNEAFRWTEATGMVGLGDLPGGWFLSDGRGVSADGNVVVGMSLVGGEEDERAFVWNPVRGMRDLKQVLLGRGLDLRGWTLSTADGISDDGRVIVGQAIAPNGSFVAYYAVLDEPVKPVPALDPLALGALGAVLAGVGRRRLRARGSC